MNSLKPTYHFMPPVNWINDPNGPIYINDEYHLFYQYNPNGDRWGSIHWGHAKSKDMVYWEHLPIALSPSLEKQEEHCFSGCTIIDNHNRPVIFYTSVGKDERNHTTGAEQWLAIGSPDLINWIKFEGNPIITADIHQGIEVTEWRDPFVWKDQDVWYMVLSGSCDGNGCVLIYRSDDLFHWEFLNILDKGDKGVWECPNFFQLADKYILIYSPDLIGDDRVRYKVGTLEKDFSFHSEYEGILDYGGREGYYAVTSFIDGQGRRILLSWMPETARGNFKGIQGWNGAHALPRVLSLKDNRLHMEPIHELRKLRKNHMLIQSQMVKGVFQTNVSGKALEIICIVKEAKNPFEIIFFRSPDGEEETVLRVDSVAGKAILNRSKSSLYSGTHQFAIEADLRKTAYSEYRIHLFLDYSTVEVFINEETAISARVYPKREDSAQVLIRAEEKIYIDTFQAWQMKGISSHHLEYNKKEIGGGM